MKVIYYSTACINSLITIFSPHELDKIPNNNSRTPLKSKYINSLYKLMTNKLFGIGNIHENVYVNVPECACHQLFFNRNLRKGSGDI